MLARLLLIPLVCEDALLKTKASCCESGVFVVFQALATLVVFLENPVLGYVGNCASVICYTEKYDHASFASICGAVLSTKGLEGTSMKRRWQHQNTSTDSIPMLFSFMIVSVSLRRWLPQAATSVDEVLSRPSSWRFHSTRLSAFDSSRLHRVSTFKTGNNYSVVCGVVACDVSCSTYSV